MKKKTEAYKRFGLVANPDKPFSRRAVPRAIECLRELGAEFLVESCTAQLCRKQWPAVEGYLNLAKQVDVLLVFGGDGTMLHVGRETVASGTPVFGINTGHLGFLTAVSVNQLPEALDKIVAGFCKIDSRPVIEARGQSNGKQFTSIAFNDFVISRGAASRIIELGVSVDGELLTRYRCDGLIISTPTGSTAYSLSAGGAIVSPSASVCAITPICPHTLSNRSVIVSLNSKLSVRVLSDKPETILTADGQVPQLLDAGSEVTIRRSRLLLNLLQLEEHSFFDTLRRKMKWSGSYV